jgi:hypothetical protein
MIRSSLLGISALDDSIEICFVFFRVVWYFLQFSKIINRNQKNCHTVLGRHFTPRPVTVGLARESFWPAGAEPFLRSPAARR